MLSAKALLCAGLLSGFAVVAVRAGHYCRCAAEFERFYDRRWLLESGRLLATVNHDFYVNGDGYYVVDGITVLPDDSDKCSANPSRAANIFLSRLGNHRELFDKNDADDVHNQAINKDENEKEGETEVEDEVVALRRNLNGNRNGSYKSYYYYLYGRNGTRKGKKKGKVCITRDVVFSSSMTVFIKSANVCFVSVPEFLTHM